MMRMSQTLIPTLREVTKEAETQSHILMLRAGLMQPFAPGLYSLLPFGQRAIKKLEQIFHEEMEKVGALEISMASLEQCEVGHDPPYSSFQITDRNDRKFALSPSHEKPIIALMAQNLNSYRQFPKVFYQIQKVFKDHPRSRLGMIDSKESTLMEAYSFGRNREEMEASCKSMEESFSKIFKRCGIKLIRSQDDIHSSQSYKFVMFHPKGDLEIAHSEETEFAMLREHCPCTSSEEEQTSIPESSSPYQKVSTPNVTTVEEVCKFLNVLPNQLIKTLLFTSGGEPIVVLVRGDREVNEHKVAKFLGSPVEMATPEIVERITGAPVGFAGPIGLNNVKILADPEVMQIKDGVTGANEADAHYIHVVPSRDFPEPILVDVRMAMEGDPCPTGKPGTLQIKRGFEIGQISKLGTEISKPLEAFYTDENGKQHLMEVGHYELNLTRILAAVLEQNYDDRGIIWPVDVAPYDIYVMPLSMKIPEVVEKANEIASELEQEGFSVLIDDRNETAGIKFNDADLLGLPIRIIIGKRSLDEGNIELTRRDLPGEKIKIPLETYLQQVKSIYSEMKD